VKEHALVIDDDPEILSIVGDLLRSLGHGFETASTQEDARNWIAKGGFSYILLDLEIPVQYGRPPMISAGKNLIQEIREAKTTRALPVIVITAHCQTEHAVDVMKLGAMDFVTKPFPSTGATLEKSITDALNKAALGAANQIGGSGKKRKNPLPKEPIRFESGEMVIASDRIELSGVQICNGEEEGGLSRKILEYLSEKNTFGKYRSQSGSQLAKRFKLERGQQGIADAISVFRKKVRSLMKEEANIEFGLEDLIKTGSHGYQLSEKVTVRRLGRGIKVTTIKEKGAEPVYMLGGLRLNQRQRWILEELKSGIQLRRINVMKKFNISAATAKRDISVMGEYIEFVGPSRGGYYQLMDKENCTSEIE